jgi:acetyl-CoA synthetase
VVLKNGREATDEMRMDILGFARKEMGPAVVSKEIEFVESIPKTRSGKILRRLLKARELGLPEGDISTLRSPKIKIEGNPIKKLILLKSILAMISFKR